MSIRITGMNSSLDTDSIVQELVKSYSTKTESYEKKKTKIEWKQEAWSDINKKIKSFYNKYANTMKYSSTYAKKSTTVSDESKASVVASDGAVSGTMNLKVDNLAATAYLTSSKLAKDSSGNAVTGSTTLADLGYSEEGDQTITINRGTKTTADDGTVSYSGDSLTFTVNKDTTLDEFAKLVSNAGYNANFDATTGRFFISGSKSGADSNFDLSDEGGVLDTLGLSTAKGASKVDGVDATIRLNGATFTSNSNTFSINGLTITAKEKTTGDGVSLSTDTDYDSIYDNIKSFFKEYDSLINEIDSLYNADSASDYEPLTDDEKEAMSDEEIEKWETKIKDSLLRQDSDLDKIGSAMRSSMLASYDINGTIYSLSSFGISTLSYFDSADNEKNAFHIDGDPDDDATSGEADKLKSMIASNPEDTAAFFQKLATGLYDSMNAIQGHSDSTKSYGSFYSDKTLQSDYDDAADELSDWEDKLADIEDRYYDQFSSMETALSKLNSQQSYISSLFS